MAEIIKEKIDKIIPEKDVSKAASASTPATTPAPNVSKPFSAPVLSSPMSGTGNFGFDVKKEKKPAVSIDLSRIKGTIINFIVPLVCLALTGAIFFIFLYPSFKAIPDLKIQLDSQQKLENQLRSKLDNLNRLVDFKTVVDENSDLVNKVLVSESAVPALLTQVDQIAKNSGLAISRLNYSLGSSDPEKTVTYELVNVNLALEGNFNQTITFMKDIENAARMINIDTVRYSLDNIDGNLLLATDFVLSSPYLFVQSDAVTDEPVDLDVSSTEFKDLITRLKSMRYYDASIIAPPPVTEEPVEEPVAEDLPEVPSAEEEPPLF